MSGNPFARPAARLEADVLDPDTLDPAGAEQGALLFARAAALWAHLDTLPPGSEHAEAKHRLEEAIYWAARAAGGTWL